MVDETTPVEHTERTVILRGSAVPKFIDELPPEALVQMYDDHGRPVIWRDGRPVLVRSADMPHAGHALEYHARWLIGLSIAILLAVCIIGGFGLHYLSQLVGSY